VKILVYIRDGRTVYVLRGRGELARLVGAEPWHEGKGTAVDRAIWNPTTGLYVWTRGIFVRFISRASIAVVEEGHPDGAVAP
jgi:hypothetical protein